MKSILLEDELHKMMRQACLDHELTINEFTINAFTNYLELLAAKKIDEAPISDSAKSVVKATNKKYMDAKMSNGKTTIGEIVK